MLLIFHWGGLLWLGRKEEREKGRKEERMEGRDRGRAGGRPVYCYLGYKGKCLEEEIIWLLVPL